MANMISGITAGISENIFEHRDINNTEINFQRSTCDIYVLCRGAPEKPLGFRVPVSGVKSAFFGRPP